MDNPNHHRAVEVHTILDRSQDDIEAVRQWRGIHVPNPLLRRGLEINRIEDKSCWINLQALDRWYLAGCDGWHQDHPILLVAISSFQPAPKGHTTVPYHRSLRNPQTAPVAQVGPIDPLN